MLNTLRQMTWLQRIVALGLVLYCSRALAEVGSLITWPMGTVVGGVLGLVVGLLAAGPIVAEGASTTCWLILWVYVLYPSFAPTAALWVGLTALIAWLIARTGQELTHRSVR